MKKKIFILVIMLVALFSVKDVYAAISVSKVTVDMDKKYCVFNPKQNEVSCGYISDMFSEDELIDGDSLISISGLDIAGAQSSYLLTQGNFIFLDRNNSCFYGEDLANPVCSGLEGYLNGVIKKGTIVFASSIHVDDLFYRVFYADKNYMIKSHGGGYGSYVDLEPLDEEPNEPSEPNDPEKPNEQEENYKLDLKCLSDKDGSHHCELYYNSTNNDSGEFEVKFRVQAKNVKGTININNKDLELESNKEYTVNGECSDADCKVLLARFNTKDINRNSSSSMEIEPISLRIDGEEKSINIENSKCEYSKVAENPKTSTYIILVATIIFAVFAGLLIALRKKEVLTKI